jgi:hypothetical protein
LIGILLPFHFDLPLSVGNFHFFSLFFS